MMGSQALCHNTGVCIVDMTARVWQKPSTTADLCLHLPAARAEVQSTLLLLQV